MRTLVLVVCVVLVVKFFVVAFWMQDQMYQRAARRNLLAGLLCVAGAGATLVGLDWVGLALPVVAVVMGISSFRMVRIGRG